MFFSNHVNVCQGSQNSFFILFLVGGLLPSSVCDCEVSVRVAMAAWTPVPGLSRSFPVLRTLRMLPGVLQKSCWIAASCFHRSGGDCMNHHLC